MYFITKTYRSQVTVRFEQFKYPLSVLINIGNLVKSDNIISYNSSRQYNYSRAYEK